MSDPLQILDPLDEADRPALVRRLLRFEAVVADRVASTVRQLPFGVARMTPELPNVYSLSTVQITRPVAPSELRTAVEAVYGPTGLTHRMLHTWLPEVAWTITPGLAEEGWEVKRLVLMAHDGRTAPSVSPLGIAPVEMERWAAAAPAFTADESWGRSPAVQADMVERDRRLAARADARFVLAEDGSAGCHVYRHGQTAQIECVHVLTDARGRGIGDGLMAAALQACGEDTTTFLIADADDWPKDWYGRLGFVPLRSGWEWVRTPST